MKCFIFLLKHNEIFPPDIKLSIKRGELIAVVGPVACGKTTLLMSLIRELETISGTVTTSGSQSEGSILVT